MINILKIIKMDLNFKGYGSCILIIEKRAARVNDRRLAHGAAEQGR
jgi:hypothetical protein